MVTFRALAKKFRSFFAANFTGGNITVTGTGVSHEDLVAIITDNFEEVATDDASAEAATYYGGFESRVETGAVCAPQRGSMPAYLVLVLALFADHVLADI